MRKVIELQEQAQERILEILNNSGIEIGKMYLENDYTFDHLLKFDIPKEFVKNLLSKNKYTKNDEEYYDLDDIGRELIVSEDDLEFITSKFKLVVKVENFGLITYGEDIGEIYLILSNFNFDPIELWINDHVEVLNRLNKYIEPKFDKLKKLLEIKKDSYIVDIPISIPHIGKDGIWINEIQEFLSDEYEFEFEGFVEDGLTEIFENKGVLKI